jgi:predicted DNA-binding protein
MIYLEALMAMYRMQILLKPEQRERLERVAKREGRTFSDTARRALEAGLRVMEGDSNLVWDRRLEALRFLDGLRKQIQDERGVYQGDLVNEARVEREAQIEQAWRKK